MTDFIKDSLELVGQPAVLFEWPTMSFVAANAAGWMLMEGLHIPAIEGDTHLLDSVGVDGTAADRYLRDKGYYAAQSTAGLMFLSMMEAQREWSRPDLVVATVHPDSERENAYMNHHRMMSMIKANELGYRTLAHMEDVLTILHDAVSVQRAMITNMNHSAAEAFRLQENVPVMRA